MALEASTTMFKPSRGPKEGRSPPGLLYSGPAGGPRGRHSNRQIAIGLIVAVCFLMGYFVMNSESGTISSIPTTVPGTKPGVGGLGNAILNDNQRNPAADSNVHEIHAEDAVPKFRPLGDQYSDEKPAGHEFKPIREPLEDVYQKPSNPPSTEQIQKNKQEVEEEIDSTSNPKGWKPQSGESTYGTPSGKKDKSNNANAPAREKWSDRPQFEQARDHV